MIVTGKKQVPFSWILLAVVPWSTMLFCNATIGTTFLFSLRKFVDNPAGLTFILTLPNYISLLLAPVCSFLSDRVWTRFGRRKPFGVISWVGMMLSLAVLPLMANLWLLIGAYILFGIFASLGAPMEALKQELVPPHQRGRSTAVMSWLQGVAGLIFYVFALGRFDDVRFLSGHLVSGEALIYWLTLTLLLVSFLLYTLGIREVGSHSPFRGEKLSFGRFFGGILDRDLWPVYLLVFGASMLRAGLGPLANLLYTDQWHYTKQDIGINVAVGGTLNIFIIAGLAIVADRLNRMRAYQVLIVLSLVVQAFYYIYVEIVLPTPRPSLVEIILFGETLSIISTLTGMVYLPLLYDYIVRDKMGTFLAGSNFISHVTAIVTLNAVGLFVSGYAILFQPAAGDAVRICLKAPASQQQAQAIVDATKWIVPETNTATRAVSTKAWYANGLVASRGACWEVRLADSQSESLARQDEDLKDKLQPLFSRRRMLQDDMAINSLRHDPQTLQQSESEIAKVQSTIDDLSREEDVTQLQMKKRLDDFERQVAAAYSSALLLEGDQIKSARLSDAVMVEFAAAEKPTNSFEKLLFDLRSHGSNVIDLRPIRKTEGYEIAVSAMLPPGTDIETYSASLATTVSQLAERSAPGLLSLPVKITQSTRYQALIIETSIVEDPLDTRISPVTRLTNNLLGFLGFPFNPAHRLDAIGRSLRSEGETEHVRVMVSGPQDNNISIVAILLPAATASPLGDGIAQRLRHLLGGSVAPSIVAQARSLYGRLVDSAAIQGITIQRPVVESSYQARTYDYMRGFLAIFILGSLGLAMTFLFVRLEAGGVIRKRGVEEAEGK